MAGIYIHIPFCRKACHYCNFHFSTSLHRKDAFLQALKQEISSLQFPVPFNHSTPIETIYIGGGTPSIIQMDELQAILDNIRQHYNVVSDVEITLEANPDDILPEKLSGWKSLGINRLSIGIQSFVPNDLQWMNRAHNAEQALQCITWAHQEGFHNLTVDLIYGTPTLSDEQWILNLEKAAALGINHLSCYALTVEPNTALHYFVQKGKVSSEISATFPF